jgi:outer membrane protein assembly factor BamB/subtilisin family serine protease
VTTYRFRSSCFAILALNSALAAAPLPTDREAPVSAAELARGFRNRTLLAKPRAGVPSEQIQQLEEAKGLALRARFDRFGGVRVMEVQNDQDVTALIQDLEASGLYEYAEPDYIKVPLAVPNDPRFGEQWGLRNTGQSQGTPGADIKATTGWDVRSSAPEVIVAVLDTGIRYTHEDLADTMWRNPGEVAGNGIDDDGNGYIDDVHGINSLVAKGSAGSGNPDDDQGHGTSVAGVIGAVGNNGKGVAGVAWQVKLMALKFDDADGVLGAGGYISNEVECIDYAIAKGAKVINISYGSHSYSRTELEVLQRARDNGIIIVAAAGNDADSNERVVSYPASYLLDNIVSVANTDRTDALSASSTYGALTDIAAPGTDILTTSRSSNTSYATSSGTSLASPMVAGAFALMRAQYPTENHRVLINRILRSVDPVPGLAGKVLTGGRLNLQRALTSTETRPFNDDFSGRSILSGEALVARGTSVGATRETGEPNHASSGSNSVWWSWTAPRSGTVTVDTTGSAFDTLLAVYTGSSVSALTQVGANDDAPGTTASRVTFSATSGTTYHIAVDGKGGAFGVIAVGVAYPPANDDWANASPLTGVSAQVDGTIVNATRQTGETLMAAGTSTGGGRTVWYRWTAPRTSSFSVAVETDSFDAIVGVYRGSSVSALTQVEVDTTSASWDATSGETYYIAVDTTSGLTGGFTLSLLEAYAAIEIGGTVPSSAAMATGGVLTIPNGSGYLLYSTNTTGFFKKLPGSIDVGTPVLGSGGMIYVTTTRGLFAVRSDESIAWEKRFDDGISGSPALGVDGTVYVHSDDGVLRAYTSSGAEKWTAPVPGESYSSPSIAPDGTIYIGSTDHHLYAISPADGSVKWRFNAGDEIYASPTLGADGTIYIGTLGSKFFAITSSGSQKWAYTTGGDISSSAAIAADGTIYFGCYDKKLYAMNPDGSLKWTYETGDEIRGSSPAVDASGTIYIGSYDGKLHAVNANGTVKQTYPTGGVIRSSPLLYAGNLIWGSNDGLLYLVFTQTAPASSSWPQHRQNSSRTGLRSVNTAPVIQAQPTSRAVAIGGSTTLTVTAEGQSPLTYQWYLNGTAIPGATQSSYTIANASAASAGNYTVVVTNSLGSVTSAAATVTVAAASDVGRIINLSARAVAGTDAKTLIVGLAISGGSGNKDLLIRGAGPSLQSVFNVPGVLTDPKLTLYSGSNPIGSNDNWDGSSQISALNTRVGAFQFPVLTSKDAAMTASLAGGTYTAHVTASSGNSSGVALAEFYDASEVFTAGTPRLTNISARSEVGRGADVLIVGFVLGGNTSRTVLIRGVGPTLGSRFNITGTLADPKIELRKGQTLVGENDNWGSGGTTAQLQTAMASVGAFDLPTGSKDAAILITLDPGAYTAVISGVGDTTGVALAEVYEVQ